MNKREAERVGRYIDKLEGIRVEGTRVWPVRGGYGYEVQCTDTRTGYPFVVTSMDEIKERVKEQEFYAEA